MPPRQQKQGKRSKDCRGDRDRASLGLVRSRCLDHEIRTSLPFRQRSRTEVASRIRGQTGTGQCKRLIEAPQAGYADMNRGRNTGVDSRRSGSHTDGKIPGNNRLLKHGGGAAGEVRVAFVFSCDVMDSQRGEACRHARRATCGDLCRAQ